MFNITTYHNTPQVVSAMNFYLHSFTSQPQESESSWKQSESLTVQKCKEMN